jgi:hypothetical protein
MKNTPGEKAGTAFELTNRPKNRQSMEPASPDIRPGKPPKISPLVFIVGSLAWLLFYVVAIIPALIDRGWTSDIMIFGLLLGGFGIGYVFYSNIYPRIIQSSWASSFQVRNFQITPLALAPGEQISCAFQILTLRELFLESVTATLYAEEVAIDDRGSDETRSTHIAQTRDFTRTYQQNLASGNLISYECTIPVLPDVPLSFDSIHNSLSWFVKFKIRFTDKSPWEKTVPLHIS